MSNPDSILEIIEDFGHEKVAVIYRPSPPSPTPDKLLIDGLGYHPPMNPRTYVEDGIRVDQDVAVKMRDGTIIYVDVYRPDGAESLYNLPTILAWCFFGKRPGDSPKTWQAFGVPPETFSKMARFEGPDPAYWCKKGYAVVNADSRGAGHSEGNLVIWGPQDGQDGADTVDWIAGQVWSNGKVGMFGNSGLAMVQWWIAAEQPAGLACIAPWEGLSDIYREFVTENGIPCPGFVNFVMGAQSGPGYIEDVVGMLKEYPMWNAYWESKVPNFAKIRIPAYITGSWSHLHLNGSVRGFRKIRSPKKWLRIHREFEWPDTYAWWNQQDLKLFYDRYLKGVRNGWELTPRVRLEIMDAFEYDFQINRPEKEFPLARTQYRKLYLDASGAQPSGDAATQEGAPGSTADLSLTGGSLSWDSVPAESQVSYDAREGLTTFDITFTEDIELTGFWKAHLWVEADGHDEMDLFLTIQKLDQNGNFLPTSVLDEPHPGAWGRLRVSHRGLDEEASTDYQPIHSHRVEERLKPGEIVLVQIAFFPYGRIWHKGEKLRLQIAGRYFREGWFEPFSWDTDNKGKHVMHTGGKYDSFLQIPVVPPRYKAGDYIYR
ncbi:MAG: CocE/NonD family hydrolase [Actinobacteria bacterium]|nr:CocE/NonD family hydrolase [Actinomycetota bacterium]